MKIFNFKKEKEPVRLAKKPEPKPLIKNGMIAGIPIEFILIMIITVSIFGLIITFMGPCTDSGVWYNMPHT